MDTPGAKAVPDQWKRGDEDRRHELQTVYVDRESHNWKRVGNILQSIIGLALIGVFVSILALRENAIRIEEQSKAINASIARIETDLSTSRKQLQITDTGMQSAQFRLDDHERRIKGLELVKERPR